jgi:hypothetical protein
MKRYLVLMMRRAGVAADPASSSGGWDITLHEWLAD